MIYTFQWIHPVVERVLIRFECIRFRGILIINCCLTVVSASLIQLHASQFNTFSLKLNVANGRMIIFQPPNDSLRLADIFEKDYQRYSNRHSKLGSARERSGSQKPLTSIYDCKFYPLLCSGGLRRKSLRQKSQVPPKSPLAFKLCHQAISSIKEAESDHE